MRLFISLTLALVFVVHWNSPGAFAQQPREIIIPADKSSEVAKLIDTIFTNDAVDKWVAEYARVRTRHTLVDIEVDENNQRVLRADQILRSDIEKLVTAVFIAVGKASIPLLQRAAIRDYLLEADDAEREKMFYLLKSKSRRIFDEIVAFNFAIFLEIQRDPNFMKSPDFPSYDNRGKDLENAIQQSPEVRLIDNDPIIMNNRATAGQLLWVVLGVLSRPSPAEDDVKSFALSLAKARVSAKLGANRIEESIEKKAIQAASLRAAARAGNLEYLKTVIKHGADINFPAETGILPLHYALLDRHADIAKFLINSGSDVNANANEFSFGTPLFLAAARQYEDVVELLLRRGANPRAINIQRKQTPLHVARNPVIIRRLIEAGADLMVRDGHGQLAVATAASGRDSVAIELLNNVSPSASLLYEMIINGGTVGVPCMPALIDNFIARGVDINARVGRAQGTLLHYIVEDSFSGCQIQMIKHLLARGADPSIKNQADQTPADLASARRKKDALEALRDTRVTKP